jgi:hypothetical protein
MVEIYLFMYVDDVKTPKTDFFPPCLVEHSSVMSMHTQSYPDIEIAQHEYNRDRPVAMGPIESTSDAS